MNRATESAAVPPDPVRTGTPPAQELMSPAFPVDYPVVFNAELIDAHALGEMEVSWTRGLCPEQAIRIFHLHDVYVVGDGLIFDRELRLIENASTRLAPDVVRAGFDAIKNRLLNGTIQHQDSLSIVIKRRAPHNYGHYVMEMLPLAILGRQHYQTRNPRYLVPRTSPGMQDVILRSLRLAGIGLDRLIVQGASEPMRFNEVVAISGLSDHGVYMSPLSVQAVASLGRSIPPGPHKKLFVIRPAEGIGERDLLNQADIQNRLAAAGFVVVEPGRLRFEDQIRLFRGADCVVGVCGSAMANIVFCPPGCSVVSLVPARFPDTFCWFNATHAGLRYMEIRGDQRSYDRAEAWTSGFSIREPDIQFLEHLGPDTVAGLVRSANAVADVTVAHVRDMGDLRGVSGAWAGRPGSRRWIEGIAVKPPDEIAADQVLYQIIQHDRQESDWVEGGGFAGTRGQTKPVLGFRLRLRGDAAVTHRCTYEATFIDGSTSGPRGDGEMAMASGFTPLEALRVVIRPRGD